MELLIRSQDKYTLSKYNNKITIVDGTGMKKTLDKSFFSAFAAMDQMQLLKDGWCLIVDDLILGTYATKERALEVLNEIQNALLIAGVDFIEVQQLNIEIKSYFAANLKAGIAIYELPEN